MMVEKLLQKIEAGHIASWVQYPVWPHTFVSPSADSRRAVVSYWQKYVHKGLVILVHHSMSRKNVVRLTDHHDMTIAVYCGRKTTKQPHKKIAQNSGPLAKRGVLNDTWGTNISYLTCFRLETCIGDINYPNSAGSVQICRMWHLIRASTVCLQELLCKIQ